VEVLDDRRLNRTLLVRQLLLRRSERTVPEALAHLVGLQSQNPWSAYLALAARLEGFDPDELGRLLLDRVAVRLVLMRSTIHLVLADDALELRPLTDAVTQRGIQTNWGRFLEGLDLAEVAAAGRSLVDAEPMTGKALGLALQERWPDRDPAALVQVVRAFVPLVQLPPRAVWGRSGTQVHTSLEEWVGRPVSGAPKAERLVERYLGAFGPAKPADLRTWWGVTGARELLEGMRDRLRTFRDERGAELFDLPEAPLAPGDVPAQVRYLPDYDNVLLGHDDRRRIMHEDLRAGLIGTPTVLVDGFVAGTWTVERTKEEAVIVVTPFGRVSRADRLDLAEEGVRLLAMTDPGLRHDVKVGAAGPPPRSLAGPGVRSRGEPSPGAGRTG
jgi:hypothetical protein